MAQRYNLRSTDEVARTLRQKIVPVANDSASDNEEDVELNQSDSESEEDEDDTSFISLSGEATGDTFSDYSEDDHMEKKSQPAIGKRKRGGSVSRDGAGSSRRGRKRSILRGKDGYKWNSKSRERLMPRQRQIMSYLPSPIGAAREKKTPLEVWELLFDSEILDGIVLHTNEEIGRFRQSTEIEINYTNAHIYKNVTLPELKALFGIFYFSGLQKTNDTNLEDLWSHEYGSVLYRATMPMRRFKFLSSMLRFDDKETRNERRNTDKFAPIREVWEKFLSNCTKYYSPHSYCTIDEQLVSFRGRCPFKMYMPGKPHKYGMKIVMLNDAKTFYMYNAEPYVGRVTTENRESVPSYYVRTLSEPIHGTSRNITCDNWFTSVEIVQRMLDEYSLTMVGTIRKNKRQIPDNFKKSGDVGSAKFAFDASKTLVSYTQKKNKIVLLLSSFHQTATIDSTTGKPEIITMYNQTKGGTDCFDQLCGEYSTARKTLRWPMRFWYGILDQGEINAMVLYNFNGDNAILNRRDFLKSLVMDLIKPHLVTRHASPFLRRDLRISIGKILHLEEPENAPETSKMDKQTRCSFCPRTKDRKVKTACSQCNRAACDDHRRALCLECLAHD